MGTESRAGNEPAKALAARIKARIEALHLTRADLHRATGIASSTFYDKLDHRPGHFTYNELGRIAWALNTTLTDLLAGD